MSVFDAMMAAMGVIERGDEELHYSDSSHRWIAPYGVDPEVWTGRVQAHLDRHRGGLDGQAPESPRDRPIPRVTGRGVPPPN